MKVEPKHECVGLLMFNTTMQSLFVLTYKRLFSFLKILQIQSVLFSQITNPILGMLVLI